ncbi:hypothetical protein BC830DRAFT_1163582 [Chytriomyces sp. MP71]|nr:hypothetical protein BC830DRAFT_1163582 [Chytriomyces sp. MP71]
MSIECGVLNCNTGYFNGTDFLCEKLKDDIVVNPVNGPEASRASLRLLKQEELDRLRETNDAVALNWTVQETETEARKIIDKIILPILNSNAKACVYPFFAVAYHQQEESTALLTQRGGPYQSTSSGLLVSHKASRPILTPSL